MPPEIVDRSITTVLKDIVGNVQQIIRAEVRLAKVAVGEEIAKAKHAAFLIVVGGLFGVVALGFAFLGIVNLLAKVVEPWQAAVLVAVGAGAIGGALVAIGATQIRHVEVPPSRTIASVQENF